MSQKQTVTINGREYDARTGLPVDTASSQRATRQQLRNATPQPTPLSSKKTAQPAGTIHSKAQRSRTLNRKFTQKPQQHHSSDQTATPKISQPTTKRLDGIKVTTKSNTPHVVHLAPKSTQPPVLPSHKQANQALSPTHAPQAQSDAPAPAHPAVTRAHKIQAEKKAAIKKTVPAARAIKETAIKEALANAPAHHARQHKQGISFGRRMTGLVAGSVALILFAGYLTYINVPNISVRVAAAQAGIDASYPGYHPDGYKLNGPVAYSDGQVRMQFAANTGNTEFTINQSRSNWDSSALLENYVKQKSHDEYSTSQEKGLTIYNYGSNAAWVSGGILYTIEGDAPLSPDQIRRIATSV